MAYYSFTSYHSGFGGLPARKRTVISSEPWYCSHTNLLVHGNILLPPYRHYTSRPLEHKMKVLLVNPEYPSIFPHIGIGHLRGFLNSGALQIDYLDLSMSPHIGPYDIIGFSIHSSSLCHVPKLFNELKASNPNAHFVCGGHHSAALPQQMLDFGFNQVVLGRGEVAMQEIILGNREPILQGKEPRYDTVPDYSNQPGIFTMPMGRTETAYPIVSSIGCPFACSFCASSSFHRHLIYFKSPHIVEKEITETLLAKESFMFEDDNFTLHFERVKTICEFIRNRILPDLPSLQWECASRADALDDDLCNLLRVSGCSRVWVGAESGSPELISACNKHTTPEIMLKGLKTAHKYGLGAVVQFVVGLPGETRKTINQSLRFLEEIPWAIAGANILQILPGTKIHEMALEKGFSNESYWKGVPLYTYENSLLTLQDWALKIMRREKG